MVLVDFWTYTCINCIRTLPYLKAWDAAYRRDGLTIVGVETPEFAFERDAGNVANAIRQFGLRYPVVQDNKMGTWNAYGNEYWPADYLIDAARATSATRPSARATTTRPKRRSARCSPKRATSVGGARASDAAWSCPRAKATPETYLGTERAPRAGCNGRRPASTTTARPPPANLALNEFAYSGTWKISGQPAVAVAGAAIDVEFQARNVYLVLSSPRRTAAAACRCCSTGIRSRPPTPARTSTTAS